MGIRRHLALPALAVTTSGQRDQALVQRAREAAWRWGVPYLERRRKAPLAPMLETQAAALLVFGAEGLTLWDPGGSLRFTPGMARLRVKRLDAGVDEDILVRLAELREGDAVLDCTLGLAADAITAARAVGPRGRVVGLETSAAIYALVGEGLAAHGFGPRSARVEVVRAGAIDFLRRQPDRAFDCVLFDPMFERPRRSSPAFEMLRRFADYTPLDPPTLDEARRVARRWVLVKSSRYSADLKKLRLTPEPGSRHATVVWARLSGTR